MPGALATVLLGCPQLLDDPFQTRRTDAGVEPCTTRLCEPALGGAGGQGGDGGAGGDGGDGGAGNGGAAGGVSGAAGSGGACDTCGAGASDAGSDASEPAGPDPAPACWTLELTDTTHGSETNCLGLHGWNEIAIDTETTGSDTNVALSFQDGDACFEGDVDSVGWGAVYNMQLGGGDTWSAAPLQITGFAFDIGGAALPPTLAVQYKNDPDEYCRRITPGGTAEVLFSDAHPGCSTSSTSVPDTTALTTLQLLFPVTTSSYFVDFCVRIRAIAGD